MNSTKTWIIVEYANAAQTTRNINGRYGADITNERLSNSTVQILTWQMNLVHDKAKGDELQIYIIIEADACKLRRNYQYDLT